MTSLCLGYLLLERANGLAIIAGGDRRDGRLERTRFLDTLGLHVFEELGPGFGLFDQSKDCLRLGLVDGAAGSIVIIADDHDIEDVAGDVVAQERVGAPHRLYLRLAPRGVE